MPRTTPSAIRSEVLSPARPPLELAAAVFDAAGGGIVEKVGRVVVNKNVDRM
jgi:hypothetical protein